MTLMSLLYAFLGGIGNTLFTIAGEAVHTGTIIAPFITSILHAYFDLFSGFIQTTVFISLMTILTGQEVPETE